MILVSRDFFIINPTTGDRTTVPQLRIGAGLDLAGVQSVTADGPDRLAVTTNAPNVVQVDLQTGDRTLLSANTDAAIPRGTGSNFENPSGIVREVGGTLIVADAGATNPKLVRVDRVTGNRSVLSSAAVGTGPNFSQPSSVAVEATGAIIVADIGTRTLLRVDPITGNRTLLSGSGPAFSRPKFVAVQEDGGLVVVDDVLDSLINVDASSGDRSIISGPTLGAGVVLIAPSGVVCENASSYLVFDSSLKAVLRIDRTTGDRTVISDWVVGIGPSFGVGRIACLLDMPLPGPPSVATGAENQTAVLGGSATLTTEASGAPNLTYQWQHNGVDLPGENAATLSLPKLRAIDDGQYRVLVANPFGSTSKTYTLTVTLPEIAVEQPTGTGLVDGAASASFGRVAAGMPKSIVFTIRNTGAGDLTGLGITLDGADAAMFTITNSPAAPVSPSGSTAFTVRFLPKSEGTKTAALHIANSDLDEGLFDINLTGLAAC